MKSFITPTYTFTPGVSGVGTVNLSGITDFNVKKLVSIINQTKGEIIYSTASTDLRYTNVSGTTITLNKDTSTMSSGDVLQVIYESSDAVLAGYVSNDGTIKGAPLTENGALGVGNGMIKFRDGFASLNLLEGPDSNIWDTTIVNQGSSFIGRGGNTLGAAYMNMSMCPLTANSEIKMVSKQAYKFPFRYMFLPSFSQRKWGEEFEISFVGVDENGDIETLTPKGDIAITGSIVANTNVITVTTLAPHGLQAGDRVIIANAPDGRVNTIPTAIATVPDDYTVTLPLNISNGTYTNISGAVIKWCDHSSYSKNAGGFVFENTTATNGTFFSRRNGFNTRYLNTTVSSITGSQLSQSAHSDSFNAASRFELYVNQEEFVHSSRAADSINSGSGINKFTQGLPDEEKSYKIMVRAKVLETVSRPIARIVSISKVGTTQATITTDVPHNLVVGSFVQIFGVRDTVNFPNLVTQTVVATVPSSTTFTLAIGSASTATATGGCVILVNAGVQNPSMNNVVFQSISRTSNIMAVVFNATPSTTPAPGSWVNIYGCDATSLGLYDGVYQFLRASGSTYFLRSVGANFGSINCSGVLIQRTDFRLHAVSMIEHTRLMVDIAGQQGMADSSKTLPVVPVSLPTLASLTSCNIAAPGSIQDQVSAAITSTTTSSAYSPNNGMSQNFMINVSAVTGTNPTMDLRIEESDDNGTNWFPVYDFPRITAVGVYRSPTVVLKGTRIRYVQTIGGTSPSFTRVYTRLQTHFNAPLLRQYIDRAIVLSTLNSTTATYYIEGSDSIFANVRCGAQTTAAAVAFEFSDDGTNWATDSVTANTVANSIVTVKTVCPQWRFARLKVNAAGTGITLGEVTIKSRGEM
jgi:hypothetical protein